VRPSPPAPRTNLVSRCSLTLRFASVELREARARRFTGRVFVRAGRFIRVLPPATSAGGRHRYCLQVLLSWRQRSLIIFTANYPLDRKHLYTESDHALHHKQFSPRICEITLQTFARIFCYTPCTLECVQCAVLRTKCPPSTNVLRCSSVGGNGRL